MSPQTNQQDFDDLVDLFRWDPLLARELLENDREIKKPRFLVWFRAPTL